MSEPELVCGSVETHSGDPCPEALQRTRVQLPACVPLLRVTPPLLPCFLSHSSAVLSIRPKNTLKKERNTLRDSEAGLNVHLS